MCAFLFSGVAILLVVAQIPTYVLIDAQIKALEIEIAQESEKKDALKDAENEVRMTKEVLAQMKATSTSASMSMVIDEIQERALTSIFFKAFYMDAPQGVLEKVQIQGVARTREELIQLKRNLESSDMFLKAEVPISDLARDADLPFAIALTLKTKK